MVKNNFMNFIQKGRIMCAFIAVFNKLSDYLKDLPNHLSKIKFKKFLLKKKHFYYVNDFIK